MPRTPIDYSKTLIYKLVHKDDYDNANIYIGSTTDFRKRKNEHKNSCNNENSKGYNAKKSQYIRENGGWECFNMIEIEKFQCNDKREAEAREEYWKCHFNAKLNSIRAYRTDVERLEYGKEYYEQNKDKIYKKYRERYEQNKDKILAYNKEHYEQNKSKILEQQKKKNREQNKEKITCECGCILTKYALTRHEKSQKHLMKIGVLKYEFVDDNDDLSLPECVVHC